MHWLDLLRVTLAQALPGQRLERRPEPTAETADEAHVHEYDRVWTTKLAIAYAAGLRTLHRALPDGSRERAIDLACGPGHYTLALARHLGFASVRGLDLSVPMIETAARNAEKAGLADRVVFERGDATRIEGVAEASVDLASFTDAAHHLVDLPAVTSALRAMERVVRPEGLVMVMDLVRLRTEGSTTRYVGALGADYVAQGLPHFLEDFRRSMFAAWTPRELRSALPPETRRVWVHLVPRGLPSLQILLGLPEGRNRTFLRRGEPWPSDENPVPEEMRSEWRMLKMALATGSRARVRPSGAR